MNKSQYKLLKDEHKAKHLAAFLHATETDHYLFEVNRKRYEIMLETIPEGTPFRERIQKMYDDTKDRLVEVNAILEATEFTTEEVKTLKEALKKVNT